MVSVVSRMFSAHEIKVFADAASVGVSFWLSWPFVAFPHLLSSLNQYVFTSSKKCNEITGLYLFTSTGKSMFCIEICMNASTSMSSLSIAGFLSLSSSLSIYSKRRVLYLSFNDSHFGHSDAVYIYLVIPPLFEEL